MTPTGPPSRDGVGRSRVSEKGCRSSRAARAGAGDDLVEADRALAGCWGVRGAPFFVADVRVAVSGAQAPAVFEEFLREAWAKNAQ